MVGFDAFSFKMVLFRGHVNIQGGYFDLPGRGTVVTSMSCGLHCYSQWNLCSRMEFSSALMQPKNHTIELSFASRFKHETFLFFLNALQILSIPNGKRSCSKQIQAGPTAAIAAASRKTVVTSCKLRMEKSKVIANCHDSLLASNIFVEEVLEH